MKKQLLSIVLVVVLFIAHQTPVFSEANPGKPCPVGESRFRPGGECEQNTPSVPKEISYYPLTCQDIPLAKISDESTFPVSIGQIMRRNITSDISQAELGGLGPNATTLNSYSPDSLAQIYAFNGLFDKPIKADPTNTRESARTYWRLMSAYEQANAKASYFQLVKNNGYINNTSIPYFNPNKPDLTPTPGTTPTTGLNTDPRLGLNIGYGHTDPKFCSDSIGKPVTFLVDLNTDEAGLRDFQSCYAGASIRIVRIKNFSSSTPTSNFASAGSRFASVFGNDYVLLGNELNALNTEYPCSSDLTSCGSTYAEQFAAFRTTFTGANLSAAPMNTSHTGYDAAKFLDGAKSAYQNSTFLANNAYHMSGGCPYDPIRCSKESYKWQSSYLNISKPIVLTEYGLAPPNEDRDLTKVIEFYNTLPSDVIAITPLIRNVCPKAKGEWLRFNAQGKLADSEGNVVDPKTCGSAGSNISANDFITVIDLANRLPFCLTSYPVCGDFMKTYLDLPETLKNAYDALLPFNFDNVRGYQVLNDIVYKENLPYIRAINDGLNNSRSGLLNLLSPQWINELRLSGLKTNPDTPFDSGKDIEGDTNGNTSSSESVQRQAVIRYANPYSASNCLIHDNSTYLPSPFTYPKELNNAPVKLNQDVDIVIDSVETEITIDPVTNRRVTKYKWSGSTQGLPVIVVNNPKLEDLNQSIKGKQSLTAMFLPNAGEAPDRDLTAPVALLNSDESDTKVEGLTFEEGKARVARTGGETQTKLCELRNKWLIPQGLQKNNVNCVDPYQSLTTSVQSPALSDGNLPIPIEANCNKNAPAGNPGNLLPVSSLVNIGFPSGADKNNLKNCYNDLVSRSNAAGYDPAFVMAIWLEESAASWYSTYPNSADFGCTVGGWKRMDYNDQVTCFMNLIGAYSRRPKECFTNNISLSYQDFLYIFAEGDGGACRNRTSTCTLSDGSTVSHYHRFCNNPQFPERMKNYYSLVTGGKTLDLNAAP